MPTILAGAIALSAAAALPPSAPPQSVAEGVTLLPGRILPARGPDGNTIVLEGRDALIVIDTGRHKAHSDGILAYAKSRGLPVAAVVNTHWHLDHTSGNGRLKRAFPALKVWAGEGMERALAGFLGPNLKEAEALLRDPRVSEADRAEANVFRDTMRRRADLLPDVLVRKTVQTTLEGRSLTLHLAADAASDGDLWLYDVKTRTAILGDLITFPAPFLDTACPSGWIAALDAVVATPFGQAIPGHGPVMSPAQVSAYREGLKAFVHCAANEEAAPVCADVWVQTAHAILPKGSTDLKGAKDYASYYVGLLREGRGKAPFCRT
jgi:glyoxylase-like metal-dependent hydrolase (beta-lactamase superfamily II)